MTVQDYNLTTEKRIRDIFGSLVRHRALLTAEIDHGLVLMPTLALHMDTSAGFLLLDTFNDEDVTEMILGGHPFSLRGSDSGVQVFCAGLIAQDLVEHEDGWALKVAMPTSINYRQRRNNFRVNLEQIADVPVSMACTSAQLDAARQRSPRSDEMPTRLLGHVLDLSARGSRMVFKDQKYPLPRPGEDEFVDISLMLPEREEPVTIPAVWRYCRHSVSQESLTVGVEFADIDNQTAEKIQGYVVRMQFQQRAQENIKRCA